MKKKILIVHTNMELGGAETSLLGLLQGIDYSKYEVTLMLMEEKGALQSLIPSSVRRIKAPKEYLALVLPIKEVVLQNHNFGLAMARILGKVLGSRQADKTYAIKQTAHRLALPFLPDISGKYDMAISFIDPHYIVEKKVCARVKLGWLHTDFSRIQPDKKYDLAMWQNLDYIVNISKSCKEKFDDKYPQLSKKSIVIENILSSDFIKMRAEEPVIEKFDKSSINILSIGRFSEAKNFDNVPEICQRIRKKGLDVKWYLIGYGGDEQLIRSKIREYGMEEYVIILGKKENPYPYIKACDVYIQPSRYEGKCVAVREAQMLAKPVIITNYATSASQLEAGVDGMIVPLDIEECANAISEIIQNKDLLKKLSENCRQRDYSNMEELQKLYRLMENED